MHELWQHFSLLVVKPYSYKPLEGLLKLNKEDYKCINLFRLLEKVEEDISPSPKGRAKRLMLFFYIIDILRSSGAPFYVKGGLVLQYYLKEHARSTNDIDILIGMDPDEFYNFIKKAFKNNIYGLDIKIANYEKREADSKYYFPTFSMDLLVSYLGKEIDTISLEGIYGDLFNKVSPKEYKGPSIIKEDYTFLGVSIEYMFADKILSITSELDRPYKHLVDAYSISQVEINMDELKKYLNIILSFENITREKLGISINEYKYEIKPNKKFTRSYFIPMIQAGYTLLFEEMVQSMNRYLFNILNNF